MHGQNHIKFVVVVVVVVIIIIIIIRARATVDCNESSVFIEVDKFLTS